MSETFSARYAALVAAGKIEADPGQATLAKHLATLERRLDQHRLARKSSSLGWLFGKREQAGLPLRGLYVYGDVGRGKTMLMEGNEHDPIQRAAAAIAEVSWLLCFDEFHVTDSTDAMILGRLFTRLFELGIIMIATSNLAPIDLYKDGLNLSVFLPFIYLLERHCEVVWLEARIDFRLEKLTGVPTWYVPDDAKAKTALDDAWQRLAGVAGAAHDLVVKGYVVRVPKTPSSWTTFR